MKRRAFVVLLIICFLLTPMNTSQGKPSVGVLFVKQSATGSGDCSSWGNACALQTALGLATSGDEIWVKKGIHKPGASTEPEKSFQLMSGVALYGGFAGGETNRSQRNWKTNITVLSGDIDNNDDANSNGVVTDAADITGTNSYHVVVSADGVVSPVLDGFTITGGSASGGVGDQDWGGGMYSAGDNTTLTNVTFRGNTAEEGGGMYSLGDNTSLTGVTFRSNTADEVDMGRGGGMVSDGENATLTNVTFSENTVNYGAGGGLSSRGKNAVLTNVTFRNNNADHGGLAGGLSLSSADAWLINVSFIGNTADGIGGGIYYSSSDATLVNTLFSGNSAYSGGGMYLYYDRSATLTNVTFSANSADHDGGGIYIRGSATIGNSILWGNTAGGEDSATDQVYIRQDEAVAGTADINDSLVQGGCPTGATCDPAFPLQVDPKFKDADGPDDLPGTADDDLRLHYESPAVDQGDNQALPLDAFDLDGDGDLTETIPLDLAGNARISGHDTVDLGAYEVGCFGALMHWGDYYLELGKGYREDFHAEVTNPQTISDLLLSYAEIGQSNLKHARQEYRGALECAATAPETEQAMTGILNATWELATGAMLQGNEDVVGALDVVYKNPGDPLGEEIDDLQDAIDWYRQGTNAYLELLASEHLSDTMALQSTRISPLDGEVTPYLDLQRLALVSAKKSRAYLELAERQFSQFTPASKAQAEATLRQGVDQATVELALLGHLWEEVVGEVSFGATLGNISDMQRLFDHLREGENPFGYGPEFVPFHFDPDDLPLNNYEQTKILADDELDAAETQVENAVGKQAEIDDDWDALQQSLNAIDVEYDRQLADLCGTTVDNELDLENCTGGQVNDQLLRAREANKRIQLAVEKMNYQNGLIRIEQQRVAEVAGIQRATAELIDPQTSQEYSDLMSQENHAGSKVMGFVFDVVDGCLGGLDFGDLKFGTSKLASKEGMIPSRIEALPVALIAGCPIGIIRAELSQARTIFDDLLFPNVDKRPPQEKLLEFQAWQQAQVKYKEAEISDAESEALIKQYMLRFAELDIELSIAMLNLQQELAVLDRMRTQVNYLLAEKAKAEAFTLEMYRDPSARVMRDYWMELADDRFEVALEYAYRAGRALEYEINWDPDFGAGPLISVDDLYNTGDIYTLDAAVAQMNTAYNDFQARPDVPIPQSSDDIVYLSQAVGFENAYDPAYDRIVTREEKFNAFVSNQANWVDLDGDGKKESLQFTFQTSIFLGNKFFSTNIFNDKIESIKLRVRGTNLGDGEMYVLLEQSGTSFIRTLDAFTSLDAYGRPIDDVREYNVMPLEARIDTAVNDASSPQVNYEFATRSVAFTTWTLTLDKVREPKNADVDITSIEEIELTMTHEASTLQNLHAIESSLPGAPGQDIFQPPPNRAYQPIGTASGWVSSILSLNRPLDLPSSAGANNGVPLGTFIGTAVIREPVYLPAVELIVVLEDGEDGNLSGYIDAVPVLDFPIVDEAEEQGPALTGSWSGDSFELQSEIYASSGVTGTRQVELHSGVISDDGETLSGKYRVTLWDLTPYPLTLSGDFSLMRATSLEYPVYMPLVFGGQ